jgi:hypothetical protein
MKPIQEKQKQTPKAFNARYLTIEEPDQSSRQIREQIS